MARGPRQIVVRGQSNRERRISGTRRINWPLRSADFKPHDAVIYGLQIDLPDGMTTFPAELVPLP